jgi:hypothetical protein
LILSHSAWGDGKQLSPRSVPQSLRARRAGFIKDSTIMTIERPMFPPRAAPAYSLVPQAEIELRPREREMVAALLGFVVCGLEYGSTLEEMKAVVLDELERARKAAAKKQRCRWVIPPTVAEEAVKASSQATAAAVQS